MFNGCGLWQDVFRLSHWDNPVSKCKVGQLHETTSFHYLFIIYRTSRLFETTWSILRMKNVYAVSGSHNFPQPLQGNILITRNKPQRLLHFIQNYHLHHRKKLEFYSHPLLNNSQPVECVTSPAEVLTFCSDEIFLLDHESEIGINTGK
jgi:hypothetical protein